MIYNVVDFFVNENSYAVVKKAFTEATCSTSKVNSVQVDRAVSQGQK